MAGKLIAVSNMKGGVGKTTTVVSIAETLAASDRSKTVLVIDLDPQASASICLAGDEVLTDMIEGGRALQDFLEERLIRRNQKFKLQDCIAGAVSPTTHQGRRLSVSLIPCGPQLRILEREIIYALTNGGFGMAAIEGRLSVLFDKDFKPLTSAFDYILFDCPPSISPFSEVAIRASDLVIVPTIPDRISNFGLNAFCSGVWKSSVSALPPPPMPYVLVSRMQQIRQHTEMMIRMELEAGASDRAYGLFKTRIPQAARLAEALVSEKEQTFTMKYGLEVSRILMSLVSEIKELVDADRH